MKTYIFDIDGTICTNTNGVYQDARPIKERIRIINDLYASGNVIIFHTARGMGTSKNNITVAIENWYQFTLDQLKIWEVNYNHLFFGKPAGDLYVDDKGESDRDFFGRRIAK